MWLWVILGLTEVFFFGVAFAEWKSDREVISSALKVFACVFFAVAYWLVRK